jgi:hypothetical protein
MVATVAKAVPVSASWAIIRVNPICCSDTQGANVSTVVGLVIVIFSAYDAVNFHNINGS